jgi:hypothetical protein
MTSLGSLLVRRNVLSVSEVRNALTRQVLYGGAFDTVLLEGGCREADLLDVIAEISGFAPMTPALLRCASPEVGELLPMERSITLDVCPVYGDEDGKLFVLAGARADCVALDEIAYELSRPLSIYSAPELRLWQARARVYGVEVPARFAELDARVSRREARCAAPGVERLSALASAV